ncbi:MAG TPA: TolC family protein [Phnomibacter sp.]|nr:TolC family protein [Phnomibacter sp.]
MKKFVLLPAVLLTALALGHAQPLLKLEDAIALALQKNFDVQLARNDEEIAKLQNNWGNAGRLPTVNAASSYNFSSNNLDQRLTNGTVIKRNGATFQQENVSVSALWRIYNGQRVLAAKTRLEEQEKVGNVQVRQQANLVVYNVITAYLNILRLERQLKVTQETLSLFEERRKLAENRFNIGTAGKSDYLQAAADYNEIKNNEINLENSIIQSKAQLNNLLARNPNEPFNAEELPTQVQLPNRAELVAGLDTLNPAMLITKSQLNILVQQHREINSQRLPTVSLTTGAGLNNSNNSAGFTLRNTTYGPNAGIQVAIPIFQGNVVKQNLKVNQIQQQSQQVQLNSLRNTLLTSLANAYNDFENSKRQYELELANQEVVKENNFIAMERFRKASITTVELRQTQISLVQSQNRMIDALYQMKQAEADVLVIMGKLVE